MAAVTPLNLHHVSRPASVAGRAPAAVLVHGWLGDENVMSIFDSAVPPAAALFRPRAPIAVDSGFGWYLDLADGDSFQAGLAALREFVRRLPEAYPVDPGRVVLIGFSQGAAMCAALALDTPEMTRGVALLAGFLPEPARPWAAPGRLAGKRALIAHGSKDETVPVAEARLARDALAAAGAEMVYVEHGLGHKMNPAALRALRGWVSEVLA